VSQQQMQQMIETQPFLLGGGGAPKFSSFWPSAMRTPSSSSSCIDWSSLSSVLRLSAGVGSKVSGGGA